MHETDFVSEKRTERVLPPLREKKQDSGCIVRYNEQKFRVKQTQTVD